METMPQFCLLVFLYEYGIMFITFKFYVFLNIFLPEIHLISKDILNFYMEDGFYGPFWTALQKYL